MIEIKRTFLWGDERPYNSYTSRIKEKYGGRIQKVSVDAGFTCPNRDGTKGRGGCIYCNNDSFMPSYCREGSDIKSQIDRGIRFLKKRYRNTAFYAAYFQAYSNTYRPLAELKEIYNQALTHPEIRGIVISTRPDCVDEPILDYLVELQKRFFLSVEYGIESCHDHILQAINRNHTFKESEYAIKMTRERGIPVKGHLLFGLPGESRDMMLRESEMISEIGLNTLKCHQLQIIRGTTLARKFKNNQAGLRLFTQQEYVDFIIEFLERLDPAISVERLVSESPPRTRKHHGWGNVRADQVHKKIESVMKERDTWQGNKFKK